MDPVTTAIIGGFAGGIAKAIVDNASTAVSNYVKKVNEGRDRLVGEIASAMNETPPEQLTEPPPHVVEPIYRGLVLRDENDLLTGMFRRLLRQSVNRETLAAIHPGYARLIEGLSPDEAIVLYRAKQMEVFKIPKDEQVPTSGKIGKPFPVDELAQPEEFAECVDRLIAMGLLEVCSRPQSIDIAGGVSGVSAIVTGGFSTGSNQTRSIPLTGLQQVAMPGKFVALTRFGAKFADACIPDNLPQQPPQEQQVEMAVDQ